VIDHGTKTILKLKKKALIMIIARSWRLGKNGSADAISLEGHEPKTCGIKGLGTSKKKISNDIRH
jgi:hypothetical protein